MLRSRSSTGMARRALRRAFPRIRTLRSVRRSGDSIDPTNRSGGRHAEPDADLSLKSRNPVADLVPLYLDAHRHMKGVTAAAVAEAHAKDLKVQSKHGVNYRNYWVDEEKGAIFCLVEAPNAEAAARVHKEAHGLVADEIHEVKQG